MLGDGGGAKLQIALLQTWLPSCTHTHTPAEKRARSREVVNHRRATQNVLHTMRRTSSEVNSSKMKSVSQHPLAACLFAPRTSRFERPLVGTTGKEAMTRVGSRKSEHCYRATHAMHAQQRSNCTTMHGTEARPALPKDIQLNNFQSPLRRPRTNGRRKNGRDDITRPPTPQPDETDPRHEDRRLPSPVPEGWDAVIQETMVPPLAQPTAQHVAQDRGAHFQSLIWCATGLGKAEKSQSPSLLRLRLYQRLCRDAICAPVCARVARPALRGRMCVERSERAQCVCVRVRVRVRVRACMRVRAHAHVCVRAWV